MYGRQMNRVAHKQLLARLVKTHLIIEPSSNFRFVIKRAELNTQKLGSARENSASFIGSARLVN